MYCVINMEEVNDKEIKEVKEMALEYIITGDMLIGEIVHDYPEVAPTLMSVGMHCLGCPSSQAESLEMACEVHGLDPDDVLRLVNARLAEIEERKAIEI